MKITPEDREHMGAAFAKETGWKHTYSDSERGDRATPNRSNRAHCCLVLLIEKFKEITSSDLLPAGVNLLDVGCGNSPYRLLFRQKFPNYIAADLPGNKNADIYIGPEGELPVADESFDCVLSSQALEHVTDPRAYLREAFRVLAPGGSLILSTHGIWPYHPDPTDFWRWTIDGLQLEIRKAGFDVVIVKGVFGLESVSLQLWQDATYEKLPRLIQPLYTWLFQTLIWVIERRHPDKLSNDASVFVVLARKGVSEAPSGNGIQALDTDMRSG